jgi:GNAT superfamily N-acetyltransferase
MFTTRSATVADAALITAHRRNMFASMNIAPQSELDRMSHTFEPWVRRRLAAGTYLGWVVEQEGRAVASAGLLLLDWPPHPLDPTGERRGYLLNVFVEPPYRGRGLARSLVDRSLEEARRRGIRVVTLHSSDAGRPIYEKTGFAPTSEMMYVAPLDR